jgi:hypothetical protein
VKASGRMCVYWWCLTLRGTLLSFTHPCCPFHHLIPHPCPLPLSPSSIVSPHTRDTCPSPLPLTSSRFAVIPTPLTRLVSCPPAAPSSSFLFSFAGML